MVNGKLETSEEIAKAIREKATKDNEGLGRGIFQECFHFNILAVC
jgi:hypothetical protein